MRLPSVSYWPPWHGQPKPAGCEGVLMTVFVPSLLVVVLVRLSSTGPFGCTGHPRCAQRFDRTVKLGSLSRKPLLRM